MSLTDLYPSRLAQRNSVDRTFATTCSKSIGWRATHRRELRQSTRRPVTNCEKETMIRLILYLERPLRLPTYTIGTRAFTSHDTIIQGLIFSPSDSRDSLIYNIVRNICMHASTLRRLPKIPNQRYPSLVPQCIRFTNPRIHPDIFVAFVPSMVSMDRCF